MKVTPLTTWLVGPHGSVNGIVEIDIWSHQGEIRSIWGIRHVALAAGCCVVF
jgi:hypothetical protein